MGFKKRVTKQATLAGKELTGAGLVLINVRQAYVRAEFLRTSLAFVLLAASVPVFAGSPPATGAALTETTTAGPAAADSSDTPPEPSSEPTAPASPPPTGKRFAHDAWAARELTYRPWSVQAGGGGNIVTGSTEDYVHGGADAAAGVTWFPNSALPLGLRLDGSYGWFTPGRQLLALGGVGYNKGERNVYGGDLDLQLDFGRPSPRQKAYLLAGYGEYRVGTSLQKMSDAPRVCGNHFCGTFPTLLASESDTSAWEPSWNAGIGWAMALDAHTSMFVEARCQRIFTRGSSMQFFPVRVGLRF